jgi:hypothetical protein
VTYSYAANVYPYEFAVSAERNRLNVYEQVIKAVEIGSQQQRINRKGIAEKTGRSPAQISAWLSGPSNWTLDTVSDLLRAVGATMEYKVVFDHERVAENYFHPLGEKLNSTSSTTGTIGGDTTVTSPYSSGTVRLVALVPA